MKFLAFILFVTMASLQVGWAAERYCAQEFTMMSVNLGGAFFWGLNAFLMTKIIYRD